VFLLKRQGAPAQSAVPDTPKQLKEDSMDILDKKNFQTHLSVVGWLQIVCGFLGLSLTVMAARILWVGGVTALRTVTVAGAVIGALVTLLSIPQLVAGIGLLSRTSWSRVMALVLSAIELFIFPFGTLLAMYTAFVLSQQAAVNAFGACCSIEDGRVVAEGA